MKNVSMLARLHVVALALAGLPLLLLSTPASAQDSATVSSSKFNPPPCDYSDTFYEDNGIIPTQVVGRFGTARRTGPPARGNGVNWVADSTCATTARNCWDQPCIARPRSISRNRTKTCCCGRTRFGPEYR